MASLDHLASDELPLLFRVALNQSIRYNTILKASTHKVEPVFNRAAMEIIAGRCRCARDYFGLIQSVFPDDALFGAAFAEVELEFAANRKLIGHLRNELEVKAGGVLPRLVAEYEEWGVGQAARLQRKMAGWAVARWRADFRLS